MPNFLGEKSNSITFPIKVHVESFQEHGILQYLGLRAQQEGQKQHERDNQEATAKDLINGGQPFLQAQMRGHACIV